MRILTVIGSIAVVATLGGCLPPYASVYISDEPNVETPYVRYQQDMYTIRSIYNQQQLADRLSTAPISHVEVYPAHGRPIECKTIFLNAMNEDQPELHLDSSLSIPLNDVHQIVLFREIPSAKRSEGFLSTVAAVVLLSLAGQGGDGAPFEWGKVAISAGVGSAIGSIFLLKKEKTLERVLLSYESHE